MPRVATSNHRVEREIGKLDKAARKAARDAGKNGEATRHDREQAQIAAAKGRKWPKV
jgi:hypothetical protein